MKKLICSALFLSILFLASGCMIPGSSPTVIVTGTPPAGEAGMLKGKVEGVRPFEYEVFVYLHVSNGWWYKPYFGERTTISLLGKWSCDVATGGIDASADKYAVYLVPRGMEIPRVAGGEALPYVPAFVDSVIVDR